MPPAQIVHHRMHVAFESLRVFLAYPPNF